MTIQAKNMHLLLAAVVLHAHAQEMARWELHLSNDSHQKLPENVKPEPSCQNYACVAKNTACDLARKMSDDWPIKRFEKLQRIWEGLHEVCNWNSSFDEWITPATSFGEINATRDEFDNADFCGVPKVADYEREIPPAKYVRTASYHSAYLDEKVGEELYKGEPIDGPEAFQFIKSFVNVLLPETDDVTFNVSEYCEPAVDVPQCVWEQFLPFIQRFVRKPLHKKFPKFQLWESGMGKIYDRLTELLEEAYAGSEWFDNGTISTMPETTRKKMYYSLGQVNYQMGQLWRYFLTRDCAVDYTEDAYMFPFAALQVSVTTTLLTDENRRDQVPFAQHDVLCYAVRVYTTATRTFRSEMDYFTTATFTSTVIGPIQPGSWECPIRFCLWVSPCWKYSCKAEAPCGWTHESSGKLCHSPYNFCNWEATDFHRQFEAFQERLATFWSDLLAPIPIWLKNILYVDRLRDPTKRYPMKNCGCKDD